jgi:hypothetical protein
VNDYDRQIAAAMLDQAKNPPMPSFVSRSVVKTMQMLRPFNIPMIAAPPPPLGACPSNRILEGSILYTVHVIAS